MNAYPDLRTASATAHLTDDQIDDQLIGDLAPTPAAHLATCSLCAERVAAALSPIDSFDSVSTAWSERRSATLPIPVPAVSRPLWQRQSAWATACLALAFGLALNNASRQTAVQPPASAPFSDPSVAVPPAASEASIQPTTQPLAHFATRPAVLPVRAAQTAVLTQTASLAPERNAQLATQIAADNHMLRSIDAAFDPSSDSPAALGLESDTTAATRAPASLQD